MELVTSTPKLQAFMARAQQQAVACSIASAQATFAEDTQRIVVIATPINKRIENIATSIAQAEVERNDLIKNVRILRGGIGIVMKANQALQRLVIARNSSVLDVLGVFGDFRIPKEITDLSSEDIAQSTKPRVYDSVYRNAVRDFVSFVTSKGYALSGKETDGGIGTEDIAVIISGIKTARYLKKQHGVSTLVGAIKDANYADERIEELSRTIAELNQEQDILGVANKEKRTQNVTLVSEVGKKQEDVRVATLQAQRLSSEISELASKADIIRTVRDLSQAELKSKVVELKSAYKNLQSNYNDLVTEQKLLRRTSKATRDQKALDLQEKALERKRAEKTLQLQGKYGRLSPVESKQKIKKELAAWEKIQREHLAEINRVKGRQGSGNNAVEQQNPSQLSKQLDDILAQMTALDGKISVLQQASTLTPEERTGRLGKMSDLMALKRQELKNQSRKVQRRETVLQNETSPELWESRIEEKMESQKFVDAARRHHPLHAIYYALNVGVDQKTQRMMDIAWSHFKQGTKAVLPKTLKRGLKTSVHFTSKGFIVDPRFPRINSELVTVLGTAIGEAYKKLTESDLAECMLPAVLDTLTNTSAALAEHRVAYKHTLMLIQKQLVSTKTKTIMHEIIEDLIAEGKITTVSGAKPTKKFIASMVDDFIGVIKTAKAVDKLAAFAWASYREDMASWIRVTFKVTRKKTMTVPSNYSSKGF